MRTSFRCGLVELALLLLGMLLIRREVWQLHAMAFTVSTWQEGMLIPLSALDGAITGAFASHPNHVRNTAAYKGLLRWGTPVFFFLYVGCAALCERLKLGAFPLEAGIIVRVVGLAIVLAGMFFRIAAYRTSNDPSAPSGPHKVLRHPDAAGKLLSLVGLPLVFNAWMPLLALPGVLVLLKWHISDQEAFRISQLGEPYLEYRKKTWNLIPRVY